MSRISLRGVTRRYGAVTALHPTDLEVVEGEFLTLLGPSGCGKTTTLRIVAGFVPPSEGRVLMGEDDVTRLPPNRRGIGMVFQDYALFPHLTVGENVAFALVERRTDRRAVAARVRELLELVGLPDAGGRRPAELSGGQQQRVALARAIAHPPRVLLMDEPLSALDLKLRQEMQVELRRIQAALGITTIFVTHDQEEAMALSDSIAVMSGGRVVQRGTAQDIYERPATRFVAEFVGGLNALPDGRAIRPHRVAFAPDGSGLPGTVVARSFAGSLWRGRVRTVAGEWSVESRPDEPMPAVGTAVGLCWRPEHVLTLRPDAPAGNDATPCSASSPNP